MIHTRINRDPPAPDGTKCGLGQAWIRDFGQGAQGASLGGMLSDPGFWLGPARALGLLRNTVHWKVFMPGKGTHVM